MSNTMPDTVASGFYPVAILVVIIRRKCPLYSLCGSIYPEQEVNQDECKGLPIYTLIDTEVK